MDISNAGKKNAAHNFQRLKMTLRQKPILKTTIQVCVCTRGSSPVSPPAHIIRRAGVLGRGGTEGDGFFSTSHHCVKMMIAKGRPNRRLRWVTSRVVIAFPQRQLLWLNIV